jgi:hypothetical protein
MTAYDSIAAGISKIFAPDVRFLCINDNMPDSLSAEEEGLIKNLIIRNMERRFPQKSTFEVS